MLKSRGRTSEVLVMRMEGWPQVVCKEQVLSGRNRDCEYDQKGRSKKGVMPYAKGEARKTTIR